MRRYAGLAGSGSKSRALLAPLALYGLLLAGAGCNLAGETGRNDDTLTKSGALTAAQQRILGFETPTADWSSPTGVLAQSTTHSQGSYSVSVKNNGWTEVISHALSSLGPVGPMISYDIRLPQTVTWGETRMIVKLPSKGFFYQELGIVPLIGMPAGSFQKIEFAIPPALATAMSGSYSDLTLDIVINAPVFTTPYLLDNITLAPATPSPPPGSPLTFSVTTPAGIGPAAMFMSTTGRLQIDDQTVLGTSGTLEKLANFGTDGFELGSLAVANADVYSAAGTTFLRSQSTVRGFVRAAGTIQTQPPVTVSGGQQPNTPTASAVTTWKVTPPTTVQPFIFLDVDQPPAAQPPMAIAPGAYAGVDVHSRSRIALRAGTYFFDSFNTEPDAKVFLDTSGGSIFIYTKTMFRYHGGFVQSAGPEGKVLVGHIGTSNVDLQVGFVGTVVAPNAQIDVRRPTTGQHKGAFFGARVECLSNATSTILHLPFDWSFMCPRGDSDGDGVSDCDDACPFNAGKTQPGACGCAVADTDRDHDGLLDCQDACPDDPTNTLCSHDHDLPPPRNDPQLGTPVQQIDQTTCNDSALVATLFGDPIKLQFPPNPLPEETAAIAAAANNMACDTTLGNPGACGAVQDPADCPLDVNNVKDGPCMPGDLSGKTRAELDAACVSQYGAGYYCRYGKQTAFCSTHSDDGDCKTSQLHCGTPDPACTAEATPSGSCGSGTCCSNPTIPDGSCASFDLCSDPGYTAPSGPADPTAYDPTTLTGAPPGITANVQPPPPSQYTDPFDDPGCPTHRSGDCWCTLGLNQPPTIEDVQTKAATHGGGSIVELHSQPDVEFHVDPRPIAFGESNFDAVASAAYKAEVTVNLPLIGSQTAPIVDLAAGVHASRCAFSTLPTRFFVLGIDFVDFTAAGSEPLDTGSADHPDLSAATGACSSAASLFSLKVDAAKRALKDAQQLVQPYTALPANTSFRKTSDSGAGIVGFCDLASTSTDPDFPAGDCASQKVAETLNQFVSYYNDVKIPAVTDAMKTLDQTSAALVSQLQAFDPDSSIRFLDVNRNDSATIVNAQLFIGPIPVNITVDVGAFYGLTGDIYYRFSPVSALGMTVDGPSAQIAAIGGKLVPSVGATLEIFAGVGFDIPGFAIKAGIAGDLTLVEVQGNLEAGVGLSVATHPDTRGIPSPLDVLGTGEQFFPPRQYEYFVDWFYDASIGIPAILEGTINAQLKLKALFFSKTFRKTILHFGPAFSLAPQTIISGGGQLGNIQLPAGGVPGNSLGKFAMEIPLVRLKPVPVPATEPTNTVVLAKPPSPLHFKGNCDQRDPR
jgi:hypothetical protein